MRKFRVELQHQLRNIAGGGRLVERYAQLEILPVREVKRGGSDHPKLRGPNILDHVREGLIPGLVGISRRNRHRFTNLVGSVKQVRELPVAGLVDIRCRRIVGHGEDVRLEGDFVVGEIGLEYAVTVQVIEIESVVVDIVEVNQHAGQTGLGPDRLACLRIEAEHVLVVRIVDKITGPVRAAEAQIVGEQSVAEADLRTSAAKAGIGTRVTISGCPLHLAVVEHDKIAQRIILDIQRERVEELRIACISLVIVRHIHPVYLNKRIAIGCGSVVQANRAAPIKIDV